MNIGLITAGGIGERMKMSVPKQFLNVYDKPIIIYTLEAFQKHPDIDSICVVCLDGWFDILKAYAKQYGIDKLEFVVAGGNNGQESIRNGVYAIAEKYSDDDIILVHDAIRPMVSAEIISDAIAVCNQYGNAISCVPCNEAIIESADSLHSDKHLNRDTIKRTHTPQAVKLGKMVYIHQEAERRKIENTVSTPILLIEVGETVYISAGSEKNVKISRTEDVDIFRALLWLKKNEDEYGG